MIEVIADKNTENLREKISLSIKNSEDIHIKYPVDLPESEITDYKSLIPAIEKLECARQDINIKITGFPLCVFPKEKHRWSSFSTMLSPFSGVFIDKCSSCNFKVFCHGIPKNYLKKFTDQELIPPTDKDLFFTDLNNVEAMKDFWEMSIDHCYLDWDLFFKEVSGKILDVGAGIGAFLSFDPERTIGIDNDLSKVENVMKKLLNLDLRHGNALAIDFPDDTFDGVHSRFVLEHMSLDEGNQVIKEMLRVLKPGGKIFIMVVGPDALSGGIWGDDTKFTRENLEAIAKSNKLKKYKVGRGDHLRSYAHFDFNALDVISNAKEIALILIGEK